MTNVECRLTNGGIASGFAFGYDPTHRSVVLIWTEYLKSKIRIPKSKICFLKFLFFDQTGGPQTGGRALY